MKAEEDIGTQRRHFLKTALATAAYVAPIVVSMSLGSLQAEASGGCPPGLEKKDPPCVPPGQAK
jgi:hypothetical protein